MSKVIMILIIFMPFSGERVVISEISFTNMENCISTGNLAMKNFSFKSSGFGSRALKAKAICVYR